MKTLKSEALEMIAKMPNKASIDDIMYHLYVLEKIRKGREAAARDETISIEELREEMKKW